MSSRRPQTQQKKQANSGLEEEFATVAARFSTLATDCRLSFLEVKLYRKYFVDTNPKTPEKLNRLHLIVRTLEQHRQNTINVLKTVHEREQILDAIHGQIDRISSSANRNASILDFQSDGLHLIYLHQQVTLRVVEAIEAWRKPLTRPFPFVHQGENYFAKILADCGDISASSLGKILPVKLAQYPLCSDLPSLCLFATPNPAASVSKSGGRQPPTRMTSEMASKINSAQAILLEELEIQKRLLRELEGLSTAGFFLPVLNLHSIIPSCTNGIRMSNHEWEEQLRGAIAEAKEDLEAAEDRTLHPRTTPSPQRGGGGTNNKGGNNNNTAGGQKKKKTAHDDDFDEDTDSSSSSSSSSRVSSPTPENSPSKRKHTPVVEDKQQPQKLPSRPSSASQPLPPPRPSSAKKRVDTPNGENTAAAPLPSTKEDDPKKKKSGSDSDDFEKDDSEDEM